MKKRFLGVIALLAISACSSQPAANVTSAKAEKEPCTVEVIYPDSVVKMLNQCYNTGRWEHCGSGGHCPAICNLARSVETPYVQQIFEPYNSKGGSLMPFSRGDQYGLVLDYPYQTPECPNEPADHSCTLPICNMGMF